MNAQRPVWRRALEAVAIALATAAALTLAGVVVRAAPLERDVELLRADLRRIEDKLDAIALRR